MFSRIAGFGREATGWGLLLLALVLFPLPVLPTVLVIAALVFLSARYSWASQLMRRTKAMLPAWFAPDASLPKNTASE
jgi:Putative transmembrane protein (PGPGW)